MNPDKSRKEGIIQQLNCISRQYDEFLKLMDDAGDRREEEQTEQKSTLAVILKKRWKQIIAKKTHK